MKKWIVSVLLMSIVTGSLCGCGSSVSQAADVEQETVMQESAGAAGQGSQAGAAGNAADAGKGSSDKIVMVWYPNESASDYQGARTEFANLVEKATGKKVEEKLTTDYSIAIEALASGSAQICFMGAEGYIEAHNKNAKVLPLFVNSGASGTLQDALYYSWLSVNTADAASYQDGGKYSIANIAGKRMSFVSNSSTSGFKVPTSAMVSFFSKTDKWKSMTTDNLIESGNFFKTVLYGGSHQGSAVNLLNGNADVAAFCDTEMAPYVDLKSGTADTAGAVYEVKKGASAPFDTLAGKQFTVISSIPVLNGPFAYNGNALSADDVKKIQDLFTSADVTNDDKIFVPKGSSNVGMFERTDKEQFVTVEDSWFDTIRKL